MSETSDKNGYNFPYTAEEDHLTIMGRNQTMSSNDMNYPSVLLSNKLSSRQSSRTSSPPGVTGIQPLAPLTSITDTSE